MAEEFPLDDDFDLTPETEPVGETREAEITTGEEIGPLDEGLPTAPEVEPLAPVDSWAEVDPDYEELLDEDAEVEDVDDELIPAGDIDTSEDEDTPFEGNRWAFYEIEGRSFSRGGAWMQLAREEFTGTLDARIDGLPAGEDWEFRGRLVDENGITSAWSETTTNALPSDDTPPPAPTTPLIDENNGFITYGWDGALQEATPEDMSHVLAFVRQMHPAGNPEGAPGDPQLLTRFMQQGTQSTGALVSDVPHELWLVAVDTTGNGSQWSEVVEFTPSEPVDAQRIRDELEVINGPDGRLPALEQSLSMGLDEVYRDLAAKADVTSEIQQAAQDQAAAAQAEYDRLQELADAARARADEVGVDQATTAAEVAQARQEATAAQEAANAARAKADAVETAQNTTAAEAEAARQEAQAAQSAADAAQAKADAVETAQGSTSAAAQAARDAADAAGAAADAAAARAEEARLAAIAAQEAAGNAQSTADLALDSANGKNRVYSSTSAPSGTANDGDLWYRWSDTSASRRLVGIWVRESGTWRSMGTLDSTLIPMLDIGAGTFGDLSGERLLAGTVGAREVNTLDLAADEARMNELWVGIAMLAEAQIDELLVNNARAKTITAPLLQSHDEGDRGWKHRPDGTSAWYHLVTGELNTEIDMEGKVSAQEASIQGRFQTDFGQNRVEIDQGDVTYYSPIDAANRTLSNVPHMKFSTPDGAGGTTDPVIAAKPTGGIVISSGRNSPEFGRAVIEIDGHASMLGGDFTSHVNTTSVYAAIGITGIGTNSQQLGGIVADGARTRLQGRTPDSHNARDMYVRGVSSAFTLPNSNSVQLINYTYGEPVPTGDRLPFVTCSTQLSNNSNGRMATVGVGNISASGFQGVAVNAGGGSPVSYNMLYNALWR